MRAGQSGASYIGSDRRPSDGGRQSSVEAHWLRASTGEPKVLQPASYLEYGTRLLRVRPQQPPPKAPKASERCLLRGFYAAAAAVSHHNRDHQTLKGCGANRWLINPYFIDSRARRSVLCVSAISFLATGDIKGGRVGVSAAVLNSAPRRWARQQYTYCGRYGEACLHAYYHVRQCLCTHVYVPLAPLLVLQPQGARRSVATHHRPLRLLCVRVSSTGTTKP